MPFYQLPPSSSQTTKGKRDNTINPARGHVDKGFDAFMKSPEWKRFRAQVAAERGAVCEDKEHEAGTSRLAGVELDHIKELIDGGEPLSRSNVMFRCRSCHKRKTNRERIACNEREHWLRVSRETGGEGFRAAGIR
jgi:hypothetical protein